MIFNKIIIKYVLVFFAFMVCLAAAFDDGEKTENVRNRRDHGGHGVTGPVHTFVKTDKHANFKWGVRHHVGHQYAGR